MTPFRQATSVLGLALLLAGCATNGNGQLGATQPQGLSQAFTAGGRAQIVIHFKGKDQLNALAKSGVDLFENVDMKQGTVGATITPRTVKALQTLGVKYTLTQGVNLGKPVPAGYQTVDAVYKDLAAVAAAHPDIMHLETIGKSLQGRPILGMRITSRPSEHLPAVRIGAGIHARELPPVELATRMIHHLADQYAKDAAVKKLVDSRDIWIVPIQNPDGRVRVEGGDAMWRKNTRKNAGGSEGVDCNRNTDNHFEGGDDDASADDFRGASPFSEPETQAIRDLSNKVKFKTSIDLHCYGGMILWPPGYSDEYSKDQATFQAIGTRLKPSAAYKAGTIARTIYQSFGDNATWEYEANHTLAFGAELATGGFAPNYAEVDNQWSVWREKLMYLIDVTGNPPSGKSEALNLFPGV